MATKIVTKNSSTASAVPTTSDLVQGELAVNVADKRLFTEDNGGSVVELGTNPYNFTANHDGSAKLATTSTGIDVTGTVVADGLTVESSGNNYVRVNSTEGWSRLYLDRGVDTGRSQIIMQTSGAEDGGAWAMGLWDDETFKLQNWAGADNNVLTASAGGDISFYDTSGTSQSLFWDASAESLGIGTTSPRATLDLGAGSGDGALSNTASDYQLILEANASTTGDIGRSIGWATGTNTVSAAINSYDGGTGLTNGLVFATASAGSLIERMRIASSGVISVKGGGGAESEIDSNIVSNVVYQDLGGYTGIPSFARGLRFFGNNASGAKRERARIDASGNVLVGKTSTGDYVTGIEMQPAGAILAYRTGAVASIFGRTDDGEITRYTRGGAIVGRIGYNTGAFTIDGAASRSGLYFGNGALLPRYNGALVNGVNADLGATAQKFQDLYLSSKTKYQAVGGNQHSIGVDANDLIIRSETAGSETARFTYGGNLLMGTTTTNIATEGTVLYGGGNKGVMQLSSTDKPALYVNRSTDGELAQFRRGGSTVVGSIGTVANRLAIGSGDVGIFFDDLNDRLVPITQTGLADRDAAIDLGYASSRFKDLYRSGSTYSTSDRNMKQDIRELTDAERNVAVACKGLLKAFRFIDAVEKDGGDANIHFGVIAQELAEAFEAEGLDANDYQVYKSATTTDEDGNKQTRLNVCYENLLAFIIAAI